MKDNELIIDMTFLVIADKLVQKKLEKAEDSQNNELLKLVLY